ncbi:GDSL-type esterase/lipase family protein [Paenibacillus segetis]|uniref:Lysophospholipase L1 n=1 Tax=Paenibacillus segetis TaxID=1325360 RepID=A0ABQ1YVF7_9BACL|nr:GDSL-type esterase/lipase family protein [Paenibacillus segetis]GGH38600.1 hypothetical protein GCM10008013_46810 [Paenibacillus segetis]
MKYGSRVNRNQSIILSLLVVILMLTGSESLFAAPLNETGEKDSSVVANGTNTNTYSIVALGDSITAGYEPGMTETSVPYGYVERLAEQGLFHGRTEATNLGILGLTSTGMKNYISAIQAGKSITADQIQAGTPDPRINTFASEINLAKSAIENADLITITIGGNDLLSLLPEVALLTQEELSVKVTDILAVYASNMNAIIAGITELNPQAQIVLGDQYLPLPSIAVGTTIYPVLQQAIKTCTATVDKVVEEYKSQGKQISAAHIAEAFAGKEIAYTHFYPETDVHPNQSGYAQIAKVMASNVWGSYLDTAGKRGEVPISVVVSGKELLTPYQPVLKNNQTFVALKDITDAIGAESKWDSKTSTVTITYGKQTVSIPVLPEGTKVNSNSATKAPSAFLNKVGKESKTYVPLALLVQGLGLDVKYSKGMKTVFVNQ